MKKILLSTLLLIIGLTTYAAVWQSQGEAEITFEKTTHNFGSFPESSPKVTCVFKFKNSGDPNPCVGPKSELTFGGQSTYILKVEGKKDAFIFMADIWRPEHPSDARYIWLPVQFKEGIPYVEWMDNWTLDFFQ